MITIYDYADVMGFDLELIRHPNQKGRWTAKFRGVGTCEGPGSGVYCATYGNGCCPEDAIAAYASQVQGRWLHVSAYIGGGGDKSRTIRCPDELGVPS